MCETWRSFFLAIQNAFGMVFNTDSAPFGLLLYFFDKSSFFFGFFRFEAKIIPFTYQWKQTKFQEKTDSNDAIQSFDHKSPPLKKQIFANLEGFSFPPCEAGSEVRHFVSKRAWGLRRRQ